MKKLFACLFICFLTAYTASAQDQTGLKSVAGNLNYGSKVESLGIGIRGQYGFTEKIRGSLEYQYFIDRHNISSWGFNTDAHYVFGISDAVSLYPIGGISFSRWTNDPGRSNGIGQKISENRLGLNLGLGGQVAVGEKTFVQVEAKESLIKDFTQLVVSVGFMYQF